MQKGVYLDTQELPDCPLIHKPGSSCVSKYRMFALESAELFKKIGL